MAGYTKRGKGAGRQRVFVIQKHAATRLHYDLRLEVGGVMKSWAVPKGPSLNPADKRLAVHVEDHPMEYNKFEGVIPKGQYGGGEVIVWDKGTYDVEGELDTQKQLERGELKFVLHGKKVRGSFVLVQLKNSKEKKDWLLIKHRDEAADETWDAEKMDTSIVSGRTLEDVRLGRSGFHRSRQAPSLPFLVRGQNADASQHVTDTGDVERKAVFKPRLAI